MDHHEQIIETLIKKANSYLNRHQPIKAVVAIKDALQHSPSSFDSYLYYLLGIARMKCFCFMLAKRSLEKALELLPNNAESFRSMGWVLVLLGNLTEGQHYLHESLKINPTNHWTHMDLGMSYIHYFDFEQGFELLKKAERLAPHDEAIKQNMRIANHMLQQFSKIPPAELQRMKKQKLRPDLQKEFRLMSLEQMFAGKKLNHSMIEDIEEEWRLNSFPGKIRLVQPP